MSPSLFLRYRIIYYKRDPKSSSAVHVVISVMALAIYRYDTLGRNPECIAR